jgi:transposase-like protein
MSGGVDRAAPPFCPNPRCRFHVNPEGWRFKKKGFFLRRAFPRRIQRYRCSHCGRSFSSQTFDATYWLKQPEVFSGLPYRLLGCSGFRQIARELGIAPTTVLRQVERLGRHCLLFHECHRPRGPLEEPLVVDGFESFEFSQYHPLHFHTAVGAHSQFFYAFTDSELRHRVTSSKEPRTPQNPLFPVNLLDLLIRHSSANHKRETIAFSKRRQSAAYRLAILLVWRNYMKSVSERRQGETPAQRLGILPRKLAVADLLRERLFPTRIALPDRIAQYYWRRVPTRRIPNAPQHNLAYAA